MLIVSFLLFPITIFYFSPYLIVMGAANGIIAGSFVMFTALFLISLFWGRAFCGYACPSGGLQECLMLAADKKAKGGKLNLIKYCIWLPWLCAIAILLIRAGGVSRIYILYHIPHGISMSEPFALIIYYFVILLAVILSLTAGRRASCHYACWIAPFMVVGTKVSQRLNLPSLHLEADKSKCSGCHLCTKKCPMSLDVKQMVEGENMRNSECILCGECVDVCGKKAIKYAFKR